ncbi:unnamed protein product [Paramecium pentaurelia]|uniref:BTB domain-containing protein n=1 Tax=Paramecium pentaurelia TaxID=43138 RepID=A0A8S1SJD3_9CILI|nr:unnamed protein product [Paramecium pentaurelia]
METDVIDLGKQVFFNQTLLLQQCFMYQQLGYIKNATLILSQQYPPIQFLIMKNYILPEITLQKIQDQSNQHTISYQVDFYLESKPQKQLFELFLTFIYTGKVVYRIREYYLPLLKLAIYFQCDILIQCLINQPKSSGIIRNFFLKFLCDIFNDQTYTKILLSHKNAQQFLEKMIIENSPSFVGHKNWDGSKKKEQFELSFKQVNPQLFIIFADVYINANPQRITFLNQFLYFINKYKNPLTIIMEDIYLGRMYQFFDEEYYNLHQVWLTERCKIQIQKTQEKILNTPFHMQHSKICDLVNKSFKAACSHQICLNCLFEYLIYRSKFQQQNNKVPQKIRCFTRFINKDICDYVFQDQDFEALKQYQIKEILNLYLQQKI